MREYKGLRTYPMLRVGLRPVLLVLMCRPHFDFHKHPERLAGYPAKTKLPGKKNTVVC